MDCKAPAFTLTALLLSLSASADTVSWTCSSIAGSTPATPGSCAVAGTRALKKAGCLIDPKSSATEKLTDNNPSHETLEVESSLETYNCANTRTAISLDRRREADEQLRFNEVCGSNERLELQPDLPAGLSINFSKVSRHPFSSQSQAFVCLIIS